MLAVMKSKFWNKLIGRFERDVARLDRIGQEQRMAYARNKLLPVVRGRLARFPNEVLLLQQELQGGRAIYLGYLFAEIGWVPEALYGPMMRAAIDAPMEQGFVKACVASFGHRRVNETLLDLVETGSDSEKARAVMGLYWADIPLVFEGSVPGYTKDNATPESRAAYDALADVWNRKDHLFLQEFVVNPDVDVRQAIIAQLNLDAAHYEPEFQHLVPEAIRVARDHEDEYIRHRVEIQLGSQDNSFGVR